jgi:hypothetical protein
LSNRISSRFTRIIKRTNNVHRRLYSSIKKSIEKKRLESNDLANTSHFNTDVKNISINLNKVLDDNNEENKNDEKIISIANDKQTSHKISRNILLDINKNNKKQAINQKNEEIKKGQRKKLIPNTPKQIKINGKIYYFKTTMYKKICLPSKLKEKTTNITNSKKDVFGHTKTDNNFNLLNINIPNKPHIKKYTNLTYRPYNYYNLQKAQYHNNRNIIKSTSFDYKDNSQFLYNKIQTGDSSFNGKKDINLNLKTNIHYISIIERERKKRNPKSENLADIFVPNNFTIEYNVQNTNNFYVNTDLILNQNNFHSITKSDNIIDQTKELYSSRNNEFQQYENFIKNCK